VPDRLREHWRTTIDAYLRTRASLRGVVIVMDARHPLREFDRAMLEFSRATGRASLCLLSKADKLSRGEGARVLASVRKELASFAPAADAQLFSSSTSAGVEEARARLAQWLFSDSG
jgi:GTP-binding protein